MKFTQLIAQWDYKDNAEGTRLPDAEVPFHVLNPLFIDAVAGVPDNPGASRLYLTGGDWANVIGTPEEILAQLGYYDTIKDVQKASRLKGDNIFAEDGNEK